MYTSKWCHKSTNVLRDKAFVLQNLSDIRCLQAPFIFQCAAGNRPGTEYLRQYSYIGRREHILSDAWKQDTDIRTVWMPLRPRVVLTYIQYLRRASVGIAAAMLIAVQVASVKNTDVHIDIHRGSSTISQSLHTWVYIWLSGCCWKDALVISPSKAN